MSEEKSSKTHFVGKWLLESGDVVCSLCMHRSDSVDRRLCAGDTYASNKCDRCKGKQQIAEIGDTLTSINTGISVIVTESNLEFSRFLVREAKYHAISKASIGDW